MDVRIFEIKSTDDLAENPELKKRIGRLAEQILDQLIERNLLGEKTFIRKPDRGEYLTGSEDEFIKVGLFELIDADLRVDANLGSGNDGLSFVSYPGELKGNLTVNVEGDSGDDTIRLPFSSPG